MKYTRNKTTENNRVTHLNIVHAVKFTVLTYKSVLRENERRHDFPCGFQIYGHCVLLYVQKSPETTLYKVLIKKNFLL